MVGRSRRFKLADTAQQIVGGFLLAGPFVVTEEVWVLAQNMSSFQGVLTAAIAVSIGYGALYKADSRDPDREPEFGGVPLRFISLVAVSYLAVILLALAFDAPQTFLGDDVTGTVAMVGVTLKAASVGAIFSVIGAATADTLF